MDHLEREDARFSRNAAYGVVVLNVATWIWLFSQIGVAGRPQPGLLAVPIVGISLMIVLPIILLQIRKPRIALATASASLVAFIVLVIAAFMASGI